MSVKNVNLNKENISNLLKRGVSIVLVSTTLLLGMTACGKNDKEKSLNEILSTVSDYCAGNSRKSLKDKDIAAFSELLKDSIKATKFVEDLEFNEKNVKLLNEVIKYITETQKEELDSKLGFNSQIYMTEDEKGNIKITLFDMDNNRSFFSYVDKESGKVSGEVPEEIIKHLYYFYTIPYESKTEKSFEAQKQETLNLVTAGEEIQNMSINVDGGKLEVVKEKLGKEK